MTFWNHHVSRPRSVLANWDLIPDRARFYGK